MFLGFFLGVKCFSVFLDVLGLFLGVLGVFLGNFGCIWVFLFLLMFLGIF